MTQPQPSDVSAMLNPPLGKKPNLSQKDTKNLRMNLQQLTLTTPVPNTYFYNIVEKQSNSGLFSNERLLICNTQQKALSYLSKIPQGYLPFTNYQQITANKVKQKCLINEVQNFKCNPVKGKISSLMIEWTDKDKTEKKWVFLLGSSKLMNDWQGLIMSLKDGTYSQQKYDQMSKVNTQPTGNNIANNPPTNVSQQPQNNPQTKPPVGSTGPKTQPFNQDPKKQGNPFQEYMKNDQTKPGQSSNPNITNSNQFNSPNQSNVPGNNPNMNNANSPGMIKRNPSNQNLKISNNLNNPNSSNNLNNENNQTIQNSRVNSAQSFGNQGNQSRINAPSNYPSKASQPNLQNPNPPTQPQPTTFMGGQSQISRRPKIPKMGQPFSNPKSNNQNLPLNNTYSNNSSMNQVPSTGNIVQSSKIQPANVYQSNENRYNTSGPYQNNNNANQLNDSRGLNHSESVPPGDFVEQLKKQRLKNPDKFVLNNQLSQQKFSSYESAQGQQPQYEHPGAYRSSNQPIQTPKNQPFQRKPSNQHYLNMQNSGDKRIPTPKQSQHKAFSRTSTHNRNLQNSNINYDNQNPGYNSYQNMGNSREIVNSREMIHQPSKSQISNSRNPNLNQGPSAGQGNNFDEYELVGDNQVYKPTTSFPQSTKNLNKIRSDFLNKKSQNLTNPQPHTTKNDSNLLYNNYMETQPQHVNRYQKYNQSSLNKLPRFDSTQQQRQDSITNLNKAINKVNTITNPTVSYNQLWLSTSNPNKKLQIHQQFTFRSRQLIKQIVEQIPYPKSQRQLIPLDSNERQNLYTFVVQGLVIKLHLFSGDESVNDSSDNITAQAPILYDHTTYDQLKREFYNYNLVLGVTGNQGRIKVPLCCLVQYRGVLAVVRADVPNSYKEVEPYAYKSQFQALEQAIKVRFLFNTFNCYQSQGYRGGQGRFIVLWNLKNLIPGIPNSLKHEHSYFRKQFLLQYDQILQDLQSSSQAHAFTLRHILPQTLSKLQSLQLQILHSNDLQRQFHKAGLSLSYLPEIYKLTESVYLKKIFMSEIVSGIFVNVARSELNHAYTILPVENMQQVRRDEMNNVVVGCAHVLINEFFSYTQRSENIWKLIVNQASKRYRIIVSKQDVIPGYILSAIVSHLNIQCDFKHKSFLKSKKFFIHQNILPRQLFHTFSISVRNYDMQSICPTYSKVKQLLAEQSSIQNYEHMSMILQLKSRNSPLPEYYRPLMEELKTYLANYIPYNLEEEYGYLDVYQYMYQQPITYNGVKSAFLAVKWLIKANQVDKANQVFQIKFHQLSFWLNQCNTAITQFYDFFSMFYASIGDFQESIILAKSSLMNVTKVLGVNSLPVADKHYQLGNIYFKLGRKNEALKQYNKTKQILVNHQKTTIPEFGIILLKIALLCLNFGELTQCLGNAIQAERIFRDNGGNESEEIECFEILARVYEITRKPSDMANLCQACGKRFNSTQNPKVLQRMLKIILWPKLSSLSSQQQNSLLPLLTKLQQNPTSYLTAFNYLHKLSTKLNIKKKLYYFLQNISILSDEIGRRDLLRKHTSYSEKVGGQAEEMLVVLEAVAVVIGWGFVVGALRGLGE